MCGICPGAVICAFCHRVGRVKAAHEVEMGLSPEMSELCFGWSSVSKMLNPSMCYLFWLRSSLCQFPSQVCDHERLSERSSSEAAQGQGTAQEHSTALVSCRMMTTASSFQQKGDTGTRSYVGAPDGESKIPGHDDLASLKIFTTWERNSTEGKYLRFYSFIILFNSNKAKLSCCNNAITMGSRGIF